MPGVILVSLQIDSCSLSALCCRFVSTVGTVRIWVFSGTIPIEMIEVLCLSRMEVHNTLLGYQLLPLQFEFLCMALLHLYIRHELINVVLAQITEEKQVVVALFFHGISIRLQLKAR